MHSSILIVSKNRNEELDRTLNFLEGAIDKKIHEIRVFLDGCTDNSIALKLKYPWVSWQVSKISLGASKARNILYKSAQGTYLFGFDDDAHPLQINFIELAEDLFFKNPNLGILAFQEIKGKFEKDIVPKDLIRSEDDFLVNDFVGCGFCIRRKVYDEIRGFPLWIDIYGEEVCVALEVLEKGYDILYTHKISVNHRVDLEIRKLQGANYFRFGKQLKNTSFFYLVYYPFPLLLKKITRLYFLNFKKYALQDRYYFKEYLKATKINFMSISKILEFRKPISKKTLKKFNSLSNPKY
tara:strand:- start:2370 stop:3257 length:888 start_codon:yes stop_codon:yes gene_type:complete